MADLDRLDLLDIGIAAASDEQAELMRWLTSSGILGVRQYNSNESYTKRRNHDVAFSAINTHNHADHPHIAGLAELAAIVNGYYVRTRHMDYKFEHSVQGDFLDREPTGPHELPAFITNKPTGLSTDGMVDLEGDTQAKYINEMFDLPFKIRADLSYLEVWLEDVTDGDVVDAADSTRHSDVAGDLFETYQKNTKLTASGMKDRLENLANRPSGSAPYEDDNGDYQPRSYQINYRINTVTLGSMAHLGQPLAPRILIGNQNSHAHQLTSQLSYSQYLGLRNGTFNEVLLNSTDVNHNHTYRITWDAAKGALDGKDLNPSHQHTVHIVQGFPGRVPFNADKARDGVIDNSNRFKLVYDLSALERVGGDIDRLAKSRYARYEYVDLAEAMETCFGLEGEGAVLTETYEFNNATVHLNDPDDPTADFDNPSLNAAQYNRTAVMVGLTDAAGRSIFDRGFNDPNLFVAKTTHPQVVNGVSYAIPLEGIVRSPLETWNPAGVELNPTGPARDQVGDGSFDDPYHDARRGSWYLTPVGIWDSQADGAPVVDPADTSAGSAWMLGADGNKYEMSASGMQMHDPFGRRLRIPIYPLAQEGSRESVETRALRNLVKDLLGKVIDGSLEEDDLKSL